MMEHQINLVSKTDGRKHFWEFSVLGFFFADFATGEKGEWLLEIVFCYD